jgi:hypothetical protein
MSSTSDKRNNMHGKAKKSTKVLSAVSGGTRKRSAR